jgi:cytochrome c biogenesis protein CcmG/thiol:disulfide interchange protein DsbE
MHQWMAGHAAATVAYIPAAERKLAPDFTLNDVSGTPVRLSDQRGKVVLLNFWATWCAPCTIEMPWFVEFQLAHSRDLTVMGISMDEKGWDSVKPFLEAKPVNYPVMLAGAEIEKLYDGVRSLPTTLIIDRAGRIAATHVGLCSRKEYETDLERMLEER